VARDEYTDQKYGQTIRRILIGVLLVVLGGLFAIWRIDSPRVEQFRNALVDRVVPSFDWALIPASHLARIVGNFQSYSNIYQQNQELRRELQKNRGWREAAYQLEQQNAKLMDLNKVRIPPGLSFITGIVLADSGSPFRHSALINVGRRDGVVDGWATMDGLGLVGRISGVGESTSRVILLTDASSRIPVVVRPSGRKAIMSGANGSFPTLAFLDAPDLVHAGDRVVTSGDGRVFPEGLLAGHVVFAKDGRFLVRIAADYGRLEFMRVLRVSPGEKIGISTTLVGGAASAPDGKLAKTGDGG